MRSFKPDHLSLLPRTVEIARSFRFCVGSFCLVRLDAERVVLREQELWTIATDQLHGAVLDEGYSKARGEVLAFGSAFAPGGRPAMVVQPKLQVGPVEKSLLVVGNRRWKIGGPTDPEPFVEMPIDDARAFGGPEHPLNPVGKGAAAVNSVHELPNVEDPAFPVRSPSDDPPPAGFGALEVTHPLRAAHRGTYGDRWAKHEFPGYASDFNREYFNVGRLDQRTPGFFRGDEPYRIEHMNADRPVLEGKLPGLRARAFVQHATAAGALFVEVAMNLETIVLLPKVACAVLLFRGSMPVSEDDASDVTHVLAALEGLEEPKPVEHYRAAFEKRLDKKVAARLKGDDLMPSWMAHRAGRPAGELSEIQELLATENLTAKNLRRGAEKRREQTQKELEERTAAAKASAEEIKAKGGTPVPFEPPPPLPPVPPLRSEPPDEEEIETMVADAEKLAVEMQAQSAKMSADRMAEARRVSQLNGIDLDAKLAEAKKAGTGPPKPLADGLLENLRQSAQLLAISGVADAENQPLAKLSDPTFEPGLREMDAKILSAYRQFGHLFPEASWLDGESAERVRRTAEADRAAGSSFAGRDFTGADLSGLDFSGADFREALLEKADLRGAKLVGANFEGAVLFRADLEGAQTSGIRLSGANLAEARLTGCDLRGTDLRGAVMVKAKLDGADLAGANLERVDLAEASLAGANLQGANLKRAAIQDVRLDGARFAGADLSGATIEHVDVSGLDFSDAKLRAADFMECRGAGAVFRGADMENVRFTQIGQRSAFEGAVFVEANLAHACLRDVDFRKADFSRATLSDADLSGADADGANFRRVVAKSSMWIRTSLRAANLAGANLYEATMKNADLRGADLHGSNLFRANLVRIRVDGSTNVKDADLTGVAFVEVEPS